MALTLGVRVDDAVSATLARRWRSLRIVLTDDDADDTATLTLVAFADLELPPESARLSFAVDGVDVGSFECHRIRGSTRAGTLSIEAASLSPDSPARDQRDASWEGKLVGEVVAAVADRAGLTASIDPAVGGLPASAAIQSGESDLAFARRVVVDAGGRLVAQDGRLIVLADTPAQSDLPALELDLDTDGTWVDWERGWRRTLGAVRASYLLEDGSTAAVVEVRNGQSAAAQSLPGVYPSREIAVAAASSHLAKAETSRNRVGLVRGFLPEANVLQPLRITGGADRVPGGLPPLVVRRVQHRIGREAATTSIEASAAAPDARRFTVRTPEGVG